MARSRRFWSKCSRRGSATPRCRCPTISATASSAASCRCSLRRSWLPPATSMPGSITRSGSPPCRSSSGFCSFGKPRTSTSTGKARAVVPVPLQESARRRGGFPKMSVLNDPALEQLLAGLHERSDEQTTIVFGDDEARDRAGASPPTDDPARLKAFLSDKLVALDRDKAEFCYQLCRAGNARRIVEIGTSFGVSKLYQAEAARANFAAAGLGEFIDLREGDLRRTLAGIEGQVDFMLVDIWIAMARPALELVAPHLRPGAIVICDNTEKYRSAYADYFAFINAPDQGFRTMTLPFDGGLEFSVRSPA